MANLPVSVTPGYEFVYDGDGRVQLTKDRLNLLGNPVVVVALANDALLFATATVATESGNNVDVAVQVVDVNGDAVAFQVALWAWIATAAAGAPAALPSGGAPSATTGTAVSAMSATVAGLYLTDASGVLVLRFTEAGALTRYFNMVLASRLLQGDQAMTWV
jgi:hypothetical protein